MSTAKHQHAYTLYTSAVNVTNFLHQKSLIAFPNTDQKATESPGACNEQMKCMKFLERVKTRYRKDGLQGLCRSALRRITPNPDLEGSWDPLESALNWLAALDSFSIVQIGAHIGDTINDPLCRFLRRELGPQSQRRPGSSVILVEPVREYYQLLQKTMRTCTASYLRTSPSPRRRAPVTSIPSRLNPPHRDCRIGFPSWVRCAQIA